MAEEEMKLFRSWSSPFGMRVVHALKIKGLQYETILEDLSNKSASLLNYNPIHKKIPVFVHNGNPICESLVILEYIDETWTQSPLLPQDPYAKSTARFWAKFGDDKVMPSIWSVFTSQGDAREEAIVQAKTNLEFLEEEIKGKKFFGGEAIGYVDLAFGWMANLIGILEEIIDLKLVDAEKFPFLSAWMSNFYDDPAIKEFWPNRDRMVEKFKAMRELHLNKVA
ncbi:hypothetical protein ABFS82_02G131600 [Erythranthe guttata]|uniref:Probable glutathione S-transferase n=1 Tax=Erythranthe guttata TaxID=4155 RepID=A0A022QGV0_ERYGU|nr:PREDICTED: glutathione transferase GST 23-like [Erythranthe guttata]EYU26814.1 hypothetical protein MIMGU_mgv1a013348mg [Erythranthe guttata]|eukprot:XP_012850049.1 PREDICTED: glutathione transferase GST 23-like [Erythranthe guttata]